MQDELNKGIYRRVGFTLYSSIAFQTQSTIHESQSTFQVYLRKERGVFDAELATSRRLRTGNRG